MEHERVKIQCGAADTATTQLISHRGDALTVSTLTFFSSAHTLNRQTHVSHHGTQQRLSN